MGKKEKVYRLIERLRRAYPDWPSTFSACKNHPDQGARGNDVCTNCIEAELAELIKFDLAVDMHEAIKDESQAWRNIEEYLDE